MHALASEFGLAVDVRPVNGAKIFPVSGGVPVTKRAPQRQAYRLLELDRWRKFLEVPLILEPRNFPSDESAAQRLVVAAGILGWDALALANAFGHAIWVEDVSFADEAVRQQCVHNAGMEFATLAAEANTDAVTARLEAFTDEAIAKQVFGMPTYIYDGEMFWGQDRIDFLARAVAANAG